MILIVAKIEILLARMLIKFITEGIFFLTIKLKTRGTFVAVSKLKALAMSEFKAKGILVALRKLSALSMIELKADGIFAATGKLKTTNVGKSMIILSGGILGRHFDVLSWLILM